MKGGLVKKKTRTVEIIPTKDGTGCEMKCPALRVDDDEGYVICGCTNQILQDDKGFIIRLKDCIDSEVASSESSSSTEDICNSCSRWASPEHLTPGGCVACDTDYNQKRNAEED